MSRASTLRKAGEKLGRHTTMRTGGPAQLWLEPENEAELTAMLEDVAHRGVPLYVLGAGSNVIALDAGYEGAVLHLGKGFDYRSAQDNHITAGGATMLPKLTHFALDNNLGNFEWACGVPGSVGGSLWGNAGARGWNGSGYETRDIAADLESLLVFERNGKRRELKRNDLEFVYRKSSLGELIVTEATFVLRPLTPEQTEAHREAVKDLLARRRATQPVSAACAGCIWKNPRIESGEFAGCQGAGALVEQLGLKGASIGGAQVSEIHGNFIINTGDATSADVFALIEKVEAEARTRAGIELEREVRFLV